MHEVQAGNAGRTTVVSTQSSPALLSNITTIFGSKVADTLTPLTVEEAALMCITGQVFHLAAQLHHTAGAHGRLHACSLGSMCREDKLIMSMKPAGSCRELVLALEELRATDSFSF